MTGLLLSRRHRYIQATCFLCGRPSKVTAPIYLPAQGDVNTNVRVNRGVQITICIGCLDEARSVATRGRKARR